MSEIKQELRVILFRIKRINFLEQQTGDLTEDQALDAILALVKRRVFDPKNWSNVYEIKSEYTRGYKDAVGDIRKKFEELFRE